MITIENDDRYHYWWVSRDGHRLSPLYSDRLQAEAFHTGLLRFATLTPPHPHTILADAINQLAMEVEGLVSFTTYRHTTIIPRLRTIRETLTPLIPD